MLTFYGKITVFILMLALAALVIWAFPAPGYGGSIYDEPTQWPGQELVTGEHITEHIRDWLGHSCQKRKFKPARESCLKVVSRQKRWKRAEVLGPMIVEVASERGIDPYIVSVVAREESSYIEGNRKGEDGELGLMQLQGMAYTNAKKRGYDLDSSLGQLQGGADHLVLSRDLCDGTLLQTLSKYQSGLCKTSHYGPKDRLRMVRAARSRFPLVAAIPTHQKNL